MTADNNSISLDDAVRSVRSRSRRRQVLDAAVKVMQTTGFHQMSMQALADEAQISVGLIYKYFGGKEDILLATILDILGAFQYQIDAAIDAAGDDTVERLVAGFRRYVEIVDENLGAVLLTYRESRTLDRTGRDRIKELEIDGAAPLRKALEAGIAAGVMEEVDTDLVIFDLMMLAHAWALKHWHFGPRYTLDAYIKAQTRYFLQIVLSAPHQETYTHLME